jgi:hypothetical protein
MLALILSVLLTQAEAPATAPSGRIFPVGLELSENAALPSGTMVLALCGKELKEVPVTVKELEAAREQEGFHIPAKKELSVPCAAELLFYKVPELKPGAVRPSLQVSMGDTGRGQLDFQGTPRTFSVGGKDYKVQQESDSPAAFRVFLVDGKKKHLLYELRPDGEGEGDATLLWAGDMNQDGRPDVILMAGAESRQISLFLSGKGSKGPLKVATYEYSGLD